MTRPEQAYENFIKGYNCCQALAVAYADEMGLSPELAAQLCSGFGGGMGRLREVCGAVSGMVFVASAVRGYSAPKDNASKAELYALVQKLAGEFEKQNGSIICRELLGLSVKKESPVPSERTEEYYKKRPCPELVKIAAEILERELFAKEDALDS